MYTYYVLPQTTLHVFYLLTVLKFLKKAGDGALGASASASDSTSAACSKLLHIHTCTYTYNV